MYSARALIPEIVDMRKDLGTNLFVGSRRFPQLFVVDFHLIFSGIGNMAGDIALNQLLHGEVSARGLLLQ